jgi:hypothetical protein
MMEHDKKLVLAKAKHVVQSKEKAERQAAKEAETGQLSSFLSDLDRMLARGITIDGADNVDLLVRTTEEFGQRVSELLNEIRTRTASLNELNIPDTIELKQITDPDLLDALKNVGDNGELLSKVQTLDQTISMLRDVIVEIKAPVRDKQGQTPKDYIPVRVVEDIDGKLRWFKQIQTPTFVGMGGSSGGGGLTDAELRASPVPVLASIDTTGLATDTNQTSGDQKTQIVNSVGTPITSKQLGAQVTSADEGLVTNTVIHGKTTAGGGSFVDVKVHPSGALTVEATLDSTQVTTLTPKDKATVAYSISAISDDGTYKYFFFEDASLNYYVMRKALATNVFTYTKGTGGYSTVYQSAILGPSGSPTWASYGATF